MPTAFHTAAPVSKLCLSTYSCWQCLGDMSFRRHQPCCLWLQTKSHLSSSSDWVQRCFLLGVTFSHWSQLTHRIHPGVWQHDSWWWGPRLAESGEHAFECTPDCLFLKVCGAYLLLTSGLAYMQGLQWATQSPVKEDWHFPHLVWRSQTESARLHAPYVSSGVPNAQEGMDFITWGLSREDCGKCKWNILVLCLFVCFSKRLNETKNVPSLRKLAKTLAETCWLLSSFLISKHILRSTSIP